MAFINQIFLSVILFIYKLVIKVSNALKTILGLSRNWLITMKLKKWMERDYDVYVMLIT